MCKKSLHGVTDAAARDFFPRVGSKEFYLHVQAKIWSRLWCVFQTKSLEMILWLFRIDWKALKEDAEYVRIVYIGLIVWLLKPFFWEWGQTILLSSTFCYRWLNLHIRTDDQDCRNDFLWDLNFCINNISMCTLWMHLSNWSIVFFLFTKKSCLCNFNCCNYYCILIHIAFQLILPCNLNCLPINIAL